MKFIIRKPHLLLRPWIECFWNVEHTLGQAGRSETILPNGKIEIIFALQGDYRIQNQKEMKVEHAWISGIHHSPLHIRYKGHSNLIGIRFLPNGLFPFLEIPVHETVNQVEHLSLHWGVFCEEILETLSQASSIEDIFILLDHFLIQKVNRNKTQQSPAIAHAIQSIKHHPEIKLSNLAETLGFTQRHFNRMFKDQTGINPKMLSQLFRFEKAFSLLFKRSDHEMTQLALEIGYYDQAHFIKDFKKFSGMTPKEYKKRAVETNNFL
jgi:AraC-like DNA-binding protein